MTLLDPRRPICNRVRSRQLLNRLQRLELHERPQERPSQRRLSRRPGARGPVAREGPVEQGGTGVDLRGAVAGAEDGIRADVAPGCGFGTAVAEAVVAGG